MVEGFVTSGDEKLSFREIALAHLKKIMQLSTEEFHGGYYKVIDNHKEYVPSRQKAYCQAVEHFAYALLPYFDTKMQDVFNTFLQEKRDQTKKIKSGWEDRITRKWERLRAIENAKKHPSNIIGQAKLLSMKAEYVFEGSPEDQAITQMRLGLCEELFAELNLLLKRLDYLKAAVYSEGEDDEFVDNDMEDPEA